ncbi:GNAT family N-acetyltransferase [Brevundimonas goettingensis]|uniref:GNAT family N-acetyltransferase n=1 Tax=Brevundimonas goettingensis TaxID=2774190 RepID=A0A975GWF3_9CAUL|nr:GNAT family N-acetyltransferase [Brevundimonas goettingensis]QTC91719.1 GNAT family N-acetyltransferase [Brevundimonas goettingensis]
MTGTLEVEIIRPEALPPADETLWRAMLAADPALASPYFRPEFTRVAGAISPDAAVAVFKQDGKTVGFFPHQTRGGTIQPLGAPMNDYHGVVAFPGQGPDLETVARLLDAPRLRVSAWVGEAEATEERQTLMVSMPEDGFDVWYAERRTTWGKYFKDKERARRSLEAEQGPITVQRNLRDPALLDQLIALKREQYKRTGRHDIFDCGWTAELLHALLKTEGEDDFGASMAAMYAGGKLVAVEYSLHAGGRYHFWFPVYEPSLARCSPGILLSMDTMRLASEVGYRVFDFGFGGEGYKKYFCNAVQTVREAVVMRPGLSSGISNAAVGLLNAAGKRRGDRLRTSVRRRWAAIEACETTSMDRLKGAVEAAQVALSKGKARAAQRLADPAVSG